MQAARQRVGWQQLHITPERVAFARPGMGITLNGIAQGHAADRVREVLQAHGIAHAKGIEIDVFEELWPYQNEGKIYYYWSHILLTK